MEPLAITTGIPHHAYLSKLQKSTVINIKLQITLDEVGTFLYQTLVLLENYHHIFDTKLRFL